MVADVKEKLDIWRYSRACSKVLISIIFFLYNLLSILYHAAILCCVLIFTPQIAIIFRYFPWVAECHSWSSMFDQGLVFGQRFDSRPGLPCCNCLQVSQEPLTAGSQDFKKGWSFKILSFFLSSLFTKSATLVNFTIHKSFGDKYP